MLNSCCDSKKKNQKQGKRFPLCKWIGVLGSLIITLLLIHASTQVTAPVANAKAEDLDRPDFVYKRKSAAEQMVFSHSGVNVNSSQDSNKYPTIAGSTTTKARDISSYSDANVMIKPIRLLTYVTDESVKEKNSVQEYQFNGKTVDILSVASNSRPSYYQTQRRTWAAHPLIRNFFYITEDDDAEPACVERTLTRKQAMAVPKYCSSRYMNSQNTTWFMQRIVHLYAKSAWLAKKSNPEGWLCAQKRFPMGLSKVVTGYAARKESLPDYLIVVDDDTYYNMDAFFSTIMSNRDSTTPYVAAGCRIVRKKNVMFPFGGFGLTFSKGSLERLSRPIDLRIDPSDDFEKAAHFMLKERNAIYEMDSFQNGKNLAHLIRHFVMQESFENVKDWTRGFCFHGHFLLSYFITYYKLSNKGLEAVLGSDLVHKSGDPVFKNICLNAYSNCNATSFACHYQKPHDMERLALETRDLTVKKQDNENNPVHEFEDLESKPTLPAAPPIPFPNHCGRQCLRYDNIIVLDKTIPAGLGDRIGIFRVLLNLAGYLCATVYVPQPHVLLNDYHNRGRESITDLKWSDLLHFKMRPLENNITILKEYTGRIDNLFPEERFNSTWQKIGKNTTSPKQITVDFEMAENTSLEDDASGRFIWYIRGQNPWSWFGGFEKLFRKRLAGQSNALSSNITTMLPSMRSFFKEGCVYSRLAAPDDMESVVDRIWAKIRNASRTDIIGYLHVRRGDVKNKCDTGPVRMKRIFNCSFQGMINKTSMLFSSDERNIEYRKQIASVVTPYAQFFDLDNLVLDTNQEDIERGAPTFRSSNYYVYQTLQWVVANASYQLKQRRSSKKDSYCQDCFNISAMPRFEKRFHLGAA